MKKKILIFSTAYLPLVGGAEIAVKEITDRLENDEFSAFGGPATGWEFHLITPKIKRGLPREEKIGNVFIHRVGFGVSLDKFFIDWLIWRAWRLERKLNFNIIWSIMASQASVAAACFKIIYPRKKLLLTLQEGDEEKHLKRYVFGNTFLYKILIRPWHTLVIKKADYITVISNYLKQRAMDSGAKAVIEIVPNGVDVNRFSAQGGPVSGWQFKKSQNDKIIITVSRLVEKNAVGDIIEALKYLPENVKLLILGDGPLKKNLSLLVTRYSLQDRVSFLGAVSHKEIPKYLARADIFIRPSLSEGMGNSFIEAMAAGVPVIGTNIGGIPDFLKDRETGLFCEVKNPKSIAEKVKLLLNDDNLREKIITNAKKLVKSYDWDLISDKMRLIFNKLI